MREQIFEMLENPTQLDSSSWDELLQRLNTCVENRSDLLGYVVGHISDEAFSSNPVSSPFGLWQLYERHAGTGEVLSMEWPELNWDIEEQ